MSIKCLSYLRVSGLGQVDGDGFDRQREAIVKCAAMQGAEIVEEYRDEGVSGRTELENRPGLAACLAHIETNGVRMVIVESSDRLARDAVVSELIIRQFQKLGCKIISANGNTDLTAGDDSNPTAKLIRQILACVAEFDRSVTVLKLKVARQRLKAQGARMEGQKPYGDHPGELETLTEIRGLRAEGATTDGIANHLNLCGTLTRSGKPWRGSTVRKILARMVA